MWDLDALAADCAADGVYEFWLTAVADPRCPSPARSAPRSTRLPSSDPPDPPQVPGPTPPNARPPPPLPGSQRCLPVNTVLVVGAGAAGCATAILLAEAGVAVEI